MRLWESPFRNVRAGAVVAGAVAILGFLNAIGNGFAFDDLFILVQNEGIHSLSTLPEAMASPYWPGRYGPGLGLWRPATTGFFGLQWALWGEIPTGYHVLNLLLHGAVTGTVVLVLGELMPPAAAFVGGLLFALHPVHVEAVANVVGAAELLSALPYLLACLLILRGGPRLGRLRLAAVLLLFGFAFLAKESAVTLPGLVLLLDSARQDVPVRELGKYLRRRGNLYLGLAAVAGVILLARYRVLGSLAEPFPPLGAEILEEIPRIWTVAETWPHIVRLLFFPKDLVVDYGPAVIPIAFGWNLVNAVGAVMVLGALVAALAAFRRRPLSRGALSGRAVGFGIVWFVITLSPTSNVFFLSGILLSERTLYLPSVGFVAAVAWLLLRFHRERPVWARGLVVVALALMAMRSWTRTPTWKDNLEVFNTLVVEHPESGRAQWVLGDTYFQTGRTREALRAYRVAMGIMGGHYTLMAEVGRRLIGAGFGRAAELILTYAWEAHPEFGLAPGLLATLYDQEGRYPEAEAAARASLADDSTDATQWHVLSRALEAQGRLEEAKDARLKAIQFGEAGHWEQWSWLAGLEVALGDTAAARAALDSARARARAAHDLLQIDSAWAHLGIEGGGKSLPESARDSQNPRLPGGGGEGGLTGGKRRK